jgi:hypothetical protein
MIGGLFETETEVCGEWWWSRVAVWLGVRDENGVGSGVRLENGSGHSPEKCTLMKLLSMWFWDAGVGSVKNAGLELGRCWQMMLRSSTETRPNLIIKFLNFENSLCPETWTGCSETDADAFPM